MVLLALGVVQKQHCRTNGWVTPDMFFHTCYSDLPVVYEQTGLAAGDAPYAAESQGHYVQQPVLTGLAMWGVAKLVPDGSGRKQPAVAGVLLGLAISARTYPVLLVVVLGLLALRAGRLREWWTTLGWAVVTAAVVVVPWLLANPEGVASTYDEWRGSTAGY